MRKLAIALAALAAIGIAVPSMTGTAQAQDSKVVVKKEQPAHKKIVIKKKERPATKVVIKRHHRPMHKKVVIKEHS